ncbi:MAG: DUF4846 domain-containing protein [Chitinophagales bacterium]
MRFSTLFHSFIVLLPLLFFACTNGNDSETSSISISSKTSSIIKTSSSDNSTTPSPAPEINQKKYNFPWLENYDLANTLANRISTPPSYERVPAKSNSFGEWMRHLPLKTGHPKVLLHNGSEKGNQGAHHAVFDIDIGKADLQQCADAVMRLRAEYLYGQESWEAIHFNFTSGDRAAYTQWRAGYRPQIKGSQVNWAKTKSPNTSYGSFKQYMIKIFQFAGTYSLSQELKIVDNIADIQAGDVFIHGGFPGHAVIVVDVAQNKKTGEKLFLLAQSYMPAQNIQLLKNPMNDDLSPWYSTNFGEELHTPEWSFTKDQLKRF